MNDELATVAAGLGYDFDVFYNDPGNDKCCVIAKKYHINCGDYSNCIECGFELMRVILSIWDYAVEKQVKNALSIDRVGAAEAIQIKKDLMDYFQAEDREECSGIAELNGHTCAMDCLDCTICVVQNSAAAFQSFLDGKVVGDD